MRHSIKLWELYKSYNKFFKENNIKVEKSDIDWIYTEFCTSKSLRVHKKNSQLFFDYLINRLHMLGTFNMFEYAVLLHHNGYTAMYSHDIESNCYTGYIVDHFDYTIKGKRIEDIEADFKNTVDFVL